MNEHKSITPCRILVADDNDMLRSILAECLMITGHVVLTADSIDTALRTIRNNTADPFRLITVEYAMITSPDRDFIAELEETLASNTPILVVADENLPNIEQEIDRGHLAAYIRKPFSCFDLIEAVEKILQRKEQSSTFDNV